MRGTVTVIDAADRALEHCWVKRQPQSEDDVTAMIETMRTQETDCIRYAGADPDIVERLWAMYTWRECDRPRAIESRGRDHDPAAPHPKRT